MAPRALSAIEADSDLNALLLCFLPLIAAESDHQIALLAQQKVFALYC